MIDTLINMAFTLPIEVIIAYTWIKMLPMRSERAMWAVMLAYFCIGIALRASGNDAWGIIFLPVYYILAPVILSKGKIGLRVLAPALILIGVAICEIVSTTLWTGITGLPISEFYNVRAHLAAYLITRVVMYATMIAWCLIARVLFGYVAHDESAQALRHFAGFAVLQAALLLFAWLVVEMHAAGADIVFAGGILFCIASVAVDAYMFASLKRYGEQQRDEQRAAALQTQLDWCLERYRDVVKEMESTSKLRHDLRNHVNVATELARRGNTERAVAHVDAMIHEVEQADVTARSTR